MKREDNPLWVERYRPQRISEVILPADVKRQLTAMAAKNDVPVNLLFAGGPGIGKTSAALALLNEIGADHIMLNGSLHGKIDTLRTLITEFASSVSFTGGRKFVLLDEADYLTNATQPALRQFMEEYSSNCGFILTCNWIDRIIEPLRGRCAAYEFKIGSEEETARIKMESFTYVKKILDAEKVKYDDKVVAYVLEKFFPDLRSAINHLQAYSNGGPIDTGILAKLKDVSIDALVTFMRERDFTSTRKWVAEHHGDYDTIIRNLYDSSRDYVSPNSIPAFVVILGKYLYQASFCADPEINMSACCAEIMMNVQWK